MKKVQCIILASICFVISCATALSYERLSDSNIKDALSNFPKQEDHPNAAAIILLNYERMEMLNDGSIVRKVISRFKIFNERGYYLAQKSIEYRDGYSNVNILFANTIKPDGTIVPLKEEDIIDAAPYSEYEYYTDIKVKKFTMPAIEPNCIVEYAYEERIIKPIIPYDLYAPFSIQDKIPLKEDVLEIILPKGRELHVAYFKTDIRPMIEEVNGKTKYTFKNLDKEEIIPEPDMPSQLDKEVFPQFHCSTLGSWNIISKWYSGLVKEQMQSDAELENFTKELIAGKTTDEDKIRAIFYFIAQKVRYVAVALGPHTHKPHLAYDVFKKRYGDCKDKTTLLLTMLKIAGVKGLPALVPADPDILDESSPTVSVFNHVIAVVPKKDGTYYWLDATNKVAALDSIPFIIPNNVLLINEDGSYKFVKTPAPDGDNEHTDLAQVIHVNENGDADIEYTYTYHGKWAEVERSDFQNMSPEARKQRFEAEGIELHNLEILNLNELELPLIIKIRGLMRNKINKNDDNSMILSSVGGIIDYDKLTTAKSRRYPIIFKDIGSIKVKKYFHFPKGYKIKKMPDNFNRQDPYNINHVKYKYDGNIFSVEAMTKDLKHKIKPEEFDAFKINALERQKYKKRVSNIIFEKK